VPEVATPDFYQATSAIPEYSRLPRTSSSLIQCAKLLVNGMGEVVSSSLKETEIQEKQFRLFGRKELQFTALLLHCFLKR
jgi:hypothetical protein